MEVAYKHLHEAPPLIPAATLEPKFLQRYQAIINLALRKRKHQRYKSITALKNDLSILLTASEKEWQTNSTAIRMARPLYLKLIKRLGTGGFIFVVLLGGLSLGALAGWINSQINNAQDYVVFDNNKIWTIQENQIKQHVPNFQARRAKLAEAIRAAQQNKGILSRDYVTLLSQQTNLLLAAAQWNDALTTLKQLIDLVGKTGEPATLASIYQNMSTCYLMQGELVSAEEMANKALQLVSEGNKYTAMKCSILKLLGDIYTEKNENEKAELIYTQLNNITSAAKLKVPGEFAFSCATLADVYRREGSLDKAEKLYNQALEWWQNYVEHNDLFTARALYASALIYFQQNKYPQAQRLAHQALPIAIAKTGAHSSFTEAIRNLYADSLFHTNFWQWLQFKVFPDERIKS
jgi:tetratricopeptide (TPR) repeat protein